MRADPATRIRLGSHTSLLTRVSSTRSLRALGDAGHDAAPGDGIQRLELDPYALVALPGNPEPRLSPWAGKRRSSIWACTPAWGWRPPRRRRGRRESHWGPGAGRTHPGFRAAAHAASLPCDASPRSAAASARPSRAGALQCSGQLLLFLALLFEAERLLVVGHLPPVGRPLQQGHIVGIALADPELAAIQGAHFLVLQVGVVARYGGGRAILRQRPAHDFGGVLGSSQSRQTKNEREGAH